MEADGDHGSRSSPVQKLADSRGDGAVAEDLASAVGEFVNRTFVVTLIITTVVAAAALALLPARPENDHPELSALLGLALLLIPLTLLIWRRQAFELLQASPWLLLVIAAASTLALWADGFSETTLEAATYTAVIVGAALGRLWWALAAATILAVAPIAQFVLFSDGNTDALQGVVIYSSTYLLLWALLAPPLLLFVRFTASTPRLLRNVRDSGLADGPERMPESLERPATAGISAVLAVEGPLDDAVALERLTPAELRVLSMMCDGHPPKAVAFELDLSIHTVRTHIKRAKQKTRARTVTELVGAIAAATGAEPR